MVAGCPAARGSSNRSTAGSEPRPQNPRAAADQRASAAELLEKLERRHVLMRIADRGQPSGDFDEFSAVQRGKDAGAIDSSQHSISARVTGCLYAMSASVSSRSRRALPVRPESDEHTAQIRCRGDVRGAAVSDRTGPEGSSFNEPAPPRGEVERRVGEVTQLAGSGRPTGGASRSAGLLVDHSKMIATSKHNGDGMVRRQPSPYVPSRSHAEFVWRSRNK